MGRNIATNPRARVSADSPSGSFTVTWNSGGSEIGGGHYYVRIAPMANAAGDPNNPFLPLGVPVCV